MCPGQAENNRALFPAFGLFLSGSRKQGKLEGVDWKNRQRNADSGNFDFVKTQTKLAVGSVVCSFFDCLALRGAIF